MAGGKKPKDEPTPEEIKAEAERLEAEEAEAARLRTEEAEAARLRTEEAEAARLRTEEAEAKGKTDTKAPPLVEAEPEVKESGYKTVLFKRAVSIVLEEDIQVDGTTIKKGTRLNFQPAPVKSRVPVVLMDHWFIKNTIKTKKG